MKEIVEALDSLADICHKKALKEDWGRDWSRGGCYLHLESSEFIESLRGKKGLPEDELGDVLFVLLSMAKHYDLSFEQVINCMRAKLFDVPLSAVNE